MMITGISLQGRWDNGVGQEFSPFVILMYFDDVTEEFTTYSDIDGEHVMTANTDTYSVAEVKMVTPVLTDRIRVIPYSHYMRSVCLRVEVMGCKVPQVQEMRVEQELEQGVDLEKTHELIVKEVREENIFPISLLVLLIISMVLVILLIIVLITLTKSKAVSPHHTTYPPPHHTSDYQSSWYLQRAEPVYQEPTHNRAGDDRKQESNMLEFYSVPSTTIEDFTYSTPHKSIVTFSNRNSSVVSADSTLSSVSTAWSSLEESAVDSSSASSTPRLPPLPSFDFFGSSFSQKLFGYFSEDEPLYTNIC